MKALLDSQREQLRPKYNDKAIALFIKELQKKLPKARVAPGGSYAKGTSVKGNDEVDVFVQFAKGVPGISEIVAKALPKATRVHGSRDYFHVKHAGYVFEIVPVLLVKDAKEIENVTDMSPLHVAYVQKHLDEKQKDDVRLAKQFTKSAGVYGAESYVKGFSGYVLELLIKIYGSFEKLLSTASKWKEQVILDPQKHYESPQAALRRLNEAKTQSPLIIVDPLQPERNAAAALSTEAFVTFKEKAKTFITKPGKEYFDTAVNKTRIKKEWKKYTVLFATKKTPKGKPDVIGCKLLAKHDKAKLLFKQSEFALVHADWRYGEKETVAWYALEKTKMPKLIEQRGPPSNLALAVEAFRQKHKGAYQTKDRWYAKVKRKYTNAGAVLKTAWK